MKIVSKLVSAALLCGLLLFGLAGCGGIVPRANHPSSSAPASSADQAGASSTDQSGPDTERADPQGVQDSQGGGIQTGLIPEQILQGESGEIHYSYYLPEDYSPDQTYPLMMAIPGYDMMWFGEDSSGSNLNWSGFLCWTELEEEMIVVSAQLTDWGDTSARQAIELTEYFLSHFSVNPNRVYASGYSAGGETMSRAVALRPDLYTAYLHGASQWDGTFDPIAQHGVAVYIFMAEGDEYYGVERAWEAYDGLRTAYERAGWSQEEINGVLQIQTPGQDYFAQRGVHGNYHGGANVVFEEQSVLDWVVSHQKQA